MPFDECKRLISIQSDFGDEYAVICKDTDPTYKKINMRIIDKNKKIRVFKNGKEIEITNICIDIYPLYNCPSNRVLLMKSVIQSHILKMIVEGNQRIMGYCQKIVSRIVNFVYKKKNRQKDIARLRKSYEWIPKFKCSFYFLWARSIGSVCTYLSKGMVSSLVRNRI